MNALWPACMIACGKLRQPKTGASQLQAKFSRSALLLILQPETANVEGKEPRKEEERGKNLRNRVNTSSSSLVLWKKIMKVHTCGS